MKFSFSGLFKFKTQGIGLKRVEFWTWIIVATLFTCFLALGDSNGLGIYQQPEHGLAKPLIIGCIINGYIIYLLGIGIVPYYFLKRQFFKLTNIVLIVFASAIVLKTISDLILINNYYPDLKDQALPDLMEDNLYFSMPIVIIGVFFGVYKALIYRSQLSPEEYMAIPSGKKLFRFKKGEIHYFEGQGNYVKVVGQFKSEMIYTTLSKLEKRVDPRYFSRIHRSYIVSMRNASYVNQKTVLVESKEIPVGNKYQKRIRRILNEK